MHIKTFDSLYHSLSNNSKHVRMLQHAVTFQQFVWITVITENTEGRPLFIHSSIMQVKVHMTSHYYDWIMKQITQLYLTSRSTVQIQKLDVPQSTKILAFNYTKGSLPWIQKPTKGPYTKHKNSVNISMPPLFKINFNNLFPYKPMFPQVVSFRSPE